MQTPASKPQPSAVRALLWQVAGLLLGVALVWFFARHFGLVEIIVRAQGKIGANKGVVVVLYPLLQAGCNVLMLPGGVLSVGSGLFFGLWAGTALNLAGNLLGATIAFGLARSTGRRWVFARLLSQSRWAALDGALDRHGWKIVFLTQVHPLFPTSLLNYLYGLTRIRFGICMLWIALGQAPGLFLYAYIGTLTQHAMQLSERPSPPRAWEYVLWLGGLVLAAVVTTALGRLALRMLAESRRADAPDADEQREPVVAISEADGPSA